MDAEKKANILARTYSFSVDLAAHLGSSDEAIVLSNIYFWINANKDNERNFVNGKYWTFNTMKDWVKMYPYLSVKQFRRIIRSLCDKGLIETGCFNKKPFDRTRWYTVTEKGLELFESDTICPNGKMELPKWENGIAQMGSSEVPKQENGIAQMGRPIPNINTNSKPNVKPNGKPNNKELDYSGLDLSDRVISVLKDFVAMRKEIKKPITQRALEIQAKRLCEMSMSEDEQITIIENSIANSWQGLFPLKKEKKSNAEDLLEFAREIGDAQKGEIKWVHQI